jgi:hypothetical protein
VNVAKAIRLMVRPRIRSSENDEVVTQRRAAQYIRMSSDNQRYSPENQALAIAAYAVEHDIEIVCTYIDKARSGLTLTRRNGLKQLVHDVKTGRADYRACKSKKCQDKGDDLYQRALRGDIAYNMMRMWQGAVGIAPADGLVSPAYVVSRQRATSRATSMALSCTSVLVPWLPDDQALHSGVPPSDVPMVSLKSTPTSASPTGGASLEMQATSSK